MDLLRETCTGLGVRTLDICVEVDGWKGIRPSYDCREAAWARASRVKDLRYGASLLSCDVDADAKQRQFHRSLHEQGFRRVSTFCLESGEDVGALARWRTSFRPFGRAGTIGMYRLDLEPADRGTSCSCLDLSILGSQVHLEWTFLDWRSSRHLVHCETGRPFFLISNSGRSV